MADIDTNETVYFATEESLSKDRLLELDSIAWERGTANVQPSSNHRNSDVVLIILTGHAEEDALTQVKKCKHYQSYLADGQLISMQKKFLIIGLADGGAERTHKTTPFALKKNRDVVRNR